tara:strand:+ start:131 stop:370 length:240 start_codon:yes stop_codon:yes gene_type:complete
MIETYKDLHPDENYKPDMSATLKQYISIYGEHPNAEHEKKEALKKIREGTYESTFRKKQGQKTTEHGERSPSLCVYGDS